jgi:aspartate kinase
MRTLVMKFGGTSVADAAAIMQVISIVRRAVESGAAPVVVVSAMSRVTDRLLAMADAASTGRTDAVRDGLEELSRRHGDAALRLMGASAGAIARDIERELAELGAVLQAIDVLRHADARALDRVAASGELLNSRLVAAALREHGLEAEFVDARSVLMTDASHGQAAPLTDATREAASEFVLPLLQSGRIPVIGGFVGRAPDGATTTLGRGGSDYSAALIGTAIDASEIQIWTDVDGMLTADPRIVEEPRVVGRLSFGEASELAYFGAKVLHPSTILPAVAHDIPVRILNSRRPEIEGTLITSSPADDSRPVTAIACKRGVTVIDVTSTRMLMAYGFLRRVFETFEHYRTPVDVVTTSEVSVSVTVDDRRRVPEIVDALREFADVNVEEDMAILCVVGENLRRRSDTASRVIGALATFPLRMVSQAASRRNLTMVLADSAAPDAMKHLHDELFELADVGRVFRPA